MMDNARTAKSANKEEFEEYVGVMLDNNKAYDRVHPHYLAQVLQKLGFPIEFVRCIENLFFDNEIFVNMNGFLTNPVKQKRGLRQGDSISPILFNFAIEPFIQSIINNTNISGYSLQPTKPIQKRKIHLPATAPIKVLAYADDILILVKSRPEYMQMEDCIKTYGKASNSKINYDKSIAFPMHGGKMEGYFGVRLRSYIQQKMKWYDYNSPDYIKYLGYPIYVSVQQRDSFISDLTAKIKAQVDFFMTRKISMYGRAKVANTMILSKLWHILRLTPIPKAAINKINSIIYQYIVDEKNLQIKKDVYYLPREEGGLGLLHVGAQQHSLQTRYIRALVSNNQQKVIPSFLFNLMAQALQLETNNPHTQIIMLFPDTRYKSNLKEGALKLILETMDTISQQCNPNLEEIELSASNCMSLPISAICKSWQDEEELRFIQQPTSKRSQVQTFFNLDPSTGSISFKTRTECDSPYLLAKIKRLHNSNQLQFFGFFTKHLQPETTQTQQPDTFAPLLKQYHYNDKVIWNCHSKEIRTLFTNNLPLTLPKGFNKLIPQQQWKLFYKTPMHQSARNIWYKLIHNKLPTRQMLFQCQVTSVENDKCIQCNEIEDARHLLISCPIKHDVWRAIFVEHVSDPTTTNPHRIYNDIKNLSLTRYLLFKPAMKFNIFDFFGTILRAIWAHHFLVFFQGVPFNPESIVKKINKELVKLSNMDSIEL
jgi:hypothetical protein